MDHKQLLLGDWEGRLSRYDLQTDQTEQIELARKDPPTWKVSPDGRPFSYVTTKRQLKFAVTVLEALDRVLSRVASPEISAFYDACHRAAGVELHYGAAVKALHGRERVERVDTTDGRSFACDVVIVAIGIVPNVELAAAAGLACELDDRGGQAERLQGWDLVWNQAHRHGGRAALPEDARADATDPGRLPRDVDIELRLEPFLVRW